MSTQRSGTQDPDGDQINTQWREDDVRWLGPGATGTGDIVSARASIMNGTETCDQILAGLASQIASLEEVQRGLTHATEESNQAQADQAKARLGEAINKMDEARQEIALAMQEFEGVAQRL